MKRCDHIIKFLFISMLIFSTSNILGNKAHGRFEISFLMKISYEISFLKEIQKIFIFQFISGQINVSR